MTNNYFKVGSRDYVFFDDMCAKSSAMAYDRAMGMRRLKDAVIYGEKCRVLEDVWIWRTRHDYVGLRIIGESVADGSQV